MADISILFSGPMIRALLEGRKTQTRRVLKPLPRRTIFFDPKKAGAGQFSDPPYAPGDRLWVRETWADLSSQPVCDLTLSGKTGIAYRATDDDEMSIPPLWRPSIFMPRWASRLTLIVTDVRVQRLQEISEDDAVAEGVIPADEPNDRRWQHYVPHGIAFRDLWDSLNAERGYGWDVNPWVCAVTFTVHRMNIDQMEAA